MRFANLWEWQGCVSRKTYLLVGVTAFALKFAVDWVVVTQFFHRSWSLVNYWRPFGAIRGFGAIDSVERGMALVLLALALPFLYLGISMTVRRLRDAGQPEWLVVLFFVPIVNLIFFAWLCATPASMKPRATEPPPWPSSKALDRWIPRSSWGSAVLSVGLTAALGLLFAFVGTEVVRSYGWGLFVALPFCLGLVSVLLHSYRQPRSFSECTLVALMPLALLGGLLLLVAIEGLICILMAAPFAVLLALLGGFLGYAIQSARWLRGGTPAALSLALLMTPTFFSVEYFVKPQPSTFVVKSAIEVNAPPERVWKEVVAFAEIAPPKELMFRAGVAYPIRAEISGHGAGAVRHCIFSTGAFVEPIEVWDEPRLLRFSVAANPAPLTELTPYGHIEPPHLHGYFESHQGQFLLTALPGGRTRLEGTTWYTHTMWPETYWHWWSDYIIHRIHLRVLNHIKGRVESGQRSTEKADSSSLRPPAAGSAPRNDKPPSFAAVPDGRKR